MQVVEKDNIRFVLIQCPICEGDGMNVICSMPGSHSDESGYKDSYQQAEGHKHIIKTCTLCNGLCIVMVPLDKVMVVTGVNFENAQTPE